MEYDQLLRDLDRIVLETYALWDPGWVTFNWRGYTYDHVQRVRGLALNLCRREGGDRVTTELAALLHDITKPYDGEYVVDQEGKRVVDSRGYWRSRIRRPVRGNAVTVLYGQLGLAGQPHNESGATIAAHLLRERGVDESTCERVAQTIRHHLRTPENVATESRCLYDADTIDANIGLPAFVRNIYINLHFHDLRKNPSTRPVAMLLRESPLDYLRPYIADNLPRWVAGKRRDFMPRLLTESGHALALARLERLEGVFVRLARELDDFASNNHHSSLAVVMHFMPRRDDPSIAKEADYLANTWPTTTEAPQARAFIDQLQREIVGTE